MSVVFKSAPELAAEIVSGLNKICIDDDKDNEIYRHLYNRELRVSCERLSVDYLRDKLGIIIEPATVSNSNIPVIAGPSTQYDSSVVQNSCNRNVVSPNSTASSSTRSSLSPELKIQKSFNYKHRELRNSNISESSSSTSSSGINKSMKKIISSQDTSSRGSSDFIKQSVSSLPGKESRKLRHSQDSEFPLYKKKQKN